jgi:hypothetical protein
MLTALNGLQSIHHVPANSLNASAPAGIPPFLPLTESRIKISGTRNSRPEAEISGAIERIIEAIAFAKCPLTLSGTCRQPGICPGCHPTIEKELAQ